MRITIITICYNDKPGLQKTLESIFAQTHQDFEHVVIDGDSTDGSKELILSCSEKFNYWISESDKGIYDAMNKGVLKSTGDYIIHMNSGDTFYSSDTLEKVFPELLSGEDIICGSSHFVNDVRWGNESYWKAPLKVSFRFFCRDTLNHQSVFIKRSLFDKTGLYNTQYKSASDWAFFLESFAFHNAKYKPLNFTISHFDRSGFSTLNRDIGAREQQDLISKKFSFFYDIGTGNELEWHYPFFKNFVRNLRKLVRALLPYSIVRYREILMNKKKQDEFRIIK